MRMRRMARVVGRRRHGGVLAEVVARVLGKGVSIEAGLIKVTEIGAPSASSSMRRPSVNDLMACLEAQYWVW